MYDDGSGSALYAAGYFTSVGGVAATFVAKWDGSSWSALGSGLGPPPPGHGVAALAVYDDGNGAALYAGGDFSSAGGAAATNLARWDGASWSPAGTGSPIEVYALGVHTLGDWPALLVSPKVPNGQAPLRAWDGLAWSVFGDGLDGSVVALTTHDDGSGSALYAGGAFKTAGGMEASHVARWDGGSWSELGGGLSGGSGHVVRDLETFDDGNGAALYAGGNFRTAGGVPASGVAKWDGASWTALGDGISGDFHLSHGGFIPAEATALAVFDEGGGPALYVGGIFTTAGAVPTINIARWNGTGWAPLGSGIVGGTDPGWVNALAVYDDGGGGELYAAGDFRRAGGLDAVNIARWNGSSWSPLGTGSNNRVEVLAAHDDGSGLALHAGLAAPLFERADSGDSFLAEWRGCDGIGPVLTCPPTVTAIAPLGAASAAVHYSVTAVDAIDPEPSLVCTPPSGSSFPVGLTWVTCTATDASGNQTTCEFSVTVAHKIRRR